MDFQLRDTNLFDFTNFLSTWDYALHAVSKFVVPKLLIKYVHEDYFA